MVGLSLGNKVYLVDIHGLIKLTLNKPLETQPDDITSEGEATMRLTRSNQLVWGIWPVIRCDFRLYSYV